MSPVIRVDDEVMQALTQKAVQAGLVFSTPNEVLRSILGVKKTEEDVNKELNKKEIVIELNTAYSAKTWYLIPIPKRNRRFFPGYKVPFSLETDIGEIKTHVTSAGGNPHVGDLDAGTYIQTRLGEWFRRHEEEIIDGTIFRVRVIEPGKRYSISIIKS